MRFAVLADKTAGQEELVPALARHQHLFGRTPDLGQVIAGCMRR
jgi:hypothetical protein